MTTRHSSLSSFSPCPTSAGSTESHWGAQYDATINDVALAIIGRRLTTFLDELGEAAQQVADRGLAGQRATQSEGGGNAVATILAALGTDVADPGAAAGGGAASAARRLSRSMDKDAIWPIAPR